MNELRLEIRPQPDDTTCGPTCLHAVYRYFGDPLSLEAVIREVRPLETGGTLGVWLACHALRRGYASTIYTYNLQIFDPSWFADPTCIPDKLRAQAEFKQDPRLDEATEAYLEYFALGGVLKYRELTAGLVMRQLRRHRPVLTGLSATYLYGCAREIHDDYDDVRGTPSGHFVVLCGYDPATRRVQIADPQSDNPLNASLHYTVDIDRLLGAILLGIVTYDANLVVLDPPAGSAE